MKKLKFFQLLGVRCFVESLSVLLNELNGEKIAANAQKVHDTILVTWLLYIIVSCYLNINNIKPGHPNFKPTT